MCVWGGVRELQIQKRRRNGDGGQRVRSHHEERDPEPRGTLARTYKMRTCGDGEERGGGNLCSQALDEAGDGEVLIHRSLCAYTSMHKFCREFI